MTHPVDIHVGARIRLLRKQRHFSQERLAESLGLTFQQVQKYERGGNRISASKLHSVSQALKVPISYFFEDYLEDENVGRPMALSNAETALTAFLKTSEGIELAKAFPAIRKPRLRRKILDLVKSLAEEG